MLGPIIVTIVMVLTGVAAFVSFRLRAGQPAAVLHPARPATIQELEQYYGIQVTLIGVTAAGGMVDFRFRVLNADKAQILFANHYNMPVLTPVGSPVNISVPEGAGHSMSFEDGKVYYMLFGNPGGIVRPGTPVQVTIGGLLLDPITAQ